MKQTWLTSVLASAALFFGAGLMAQEDPNKDLVKKTDQQIMEELQNYAKKVSHQMEDLEDGLAKSSLPARKADELRAELEAMIDQLKSGKATRLHSGLDSYLREDPERLGKLLDLTKEDAAKLLEKDAEVIKRLGESGDKLSKLLEEAPVLEEVLKRQQALEKTMTNEFAKQDQTSKETLQDIREVIRRVQEMQDRSCWPSSGEQPSGQEGDQQQGENKQNNPANKPSQGAQEGYNPNPGPKPDAERGAEREVGKDVWDVALRKKEAEAARAKEETGKEPARYKGFKEAFRKNTDERKTESETPAPAGE